MAPTTATTTKTSSRAVAVESAPSPTVVPDKIAGAQRSISMTDAGLKYRLLTEDQRTFRGRVLGMLNGGGPTAEFWAIRNFNLQIQQGDVLGVVGSNGSGKSTLMRLMSRVIEPTEGRVEVQGEISPMLELGGAFNLELTGRENTYLQGALHKIPRSEMTDLIPKIQAFADIGPFFDVPMKAYSTGMVSRLAFAVSVQTRPDILLVDEVFSVGDENFQRKSALRMRKLIDEGVVVVLVTHNIGLIRQICNRTIWVDRGRLVEDGKPNDVTDAYYRHASR